MDRDAAMIHLCALLPVLKPASIVSSHPSPGWWGGGWASWAPTATPPCGSAGAPGRLAPRLTRAAAAMATSKHGDAA